MQRHYPAVIFMFTAFLLIACGEKDSAPILAKVDDKTITRPEFEAYLKFKRVAAEDQTRREKLLDQYLERAALAAAIEDEKILDRELIEAELNEFRKEMLISRYFEAFLKDKVTPEAIRNYYNTHAEDYEERKALAAHILVRTNPKMSEVERKAKLTTAQEAYSLLRSGRNFADVAAEYSEDKISAQKGGQLGWIKEGAIDPRFSEVLFGLKSGGFSEPFETPFGFHIVKLVEGPQMVKKPFENVAGDIRYMLRNKAKKTELERLLGQVRIEKTNAK
jgi:peptidyl-prolyl cis-trans isomerase C